MAYLIPLLSAYIVYIYNYRKVADIKAEVRIIKTIMDENDKWVIDQFNKVGDRISKLELKVKGLEVKLALYTAIAVFASTAAVKWIDKLI